MAGFLSSLEAIGTGLGQGAQAIREDQQAAARLALNQLALQQGQQRIRQQQLQDQALTASWPGLVAAYGQGQPQGQPPGGIGTGFVGPAPSGPPTSLMPSGGFQTPPVMPAAQYLAASPAQQVRADIAQVPVPPSLAPIYARESGGNYRAQNPASSASGAGQDIDSTWREAMQGLGYGNAYPHAKDAPPSVQNAANIWLQAKYGNAPWTASAGSGLTSAAQRATRELMAQMPPEVAAQGQQAAGQAAQQIDPIEYGRVTMQRAIEAINKQDIPDEAKVMAIMNMSQLIQPQDRMLLSLYMAQNRDLLAQRRLDTTEQLGEERLDIERRRLVDQEKKQVTGGGGLEASKTLEILDKDDNVVRTVLAREGRGKAGWVDSTTGDPLKFNPGEHVREVTPTSAGGGRAGAQVLRQQIGGREVLSDLQNVTTLPIGQTIGALGTVQPGTSIGEALKGDLVRSVTSQDAQLMQASMASMSRELSILMSPVYGGNWAAQQIDPLIPKAGDTIGTTQFKLARLAQSADNALEALQKSPVLSNDQKQYAKELRAQIQEAIPWTPAESQGFARFAGEGESFASFVDRWRKNIPEGSKPVPGKTVNGVPVFQAPDGSFHTLDNPPASNASHP